MFKKILIGSAIALVLGIFVGFIGFPKLLNKMIKGQLNLKPGSEPRQMWEKFPIALNFSIYVFNVTNPDEVQNGGKPRVQEVGPFVFEEWKDKYDLEDFEDEDAVAYNMRNTFIFRPDLGLSGEDLIVMPHPLVQIMAIAVKRDKEALINMISEGLQALFKPTTPFVRAPFMDIFFRGIDVDCSIDHFAAKAICLNFHTGAIKGAEKVNATHFKFSLLGGANHTDAGRYKVARGVKVSRDIGRVLEFDDSDELSVWDGDECNQFRGTDTTIFAPLMKPEEGLWSFAADLCRSLGAEFEKKTTYAGIPAYYYTIDLGDPKNDPDKHCFCKDYPDDCPPKGTMDLTLCNEAPMIVSLPHFFKADPQLVADVDGVDPVEEKHGVFIVFERISGTPLSAAKRLQFSLSVMPVPEVEVMKNLRTLTMPLFWVEEAASLDKTWTDMLKKKVFLVIKINNVFKWMSTIFGALGLAISLYMLFGRNQITTTNVTPTTEASTIDKH
ncbi:sensory neuron membrane protein 1-like [Bactrocera tryoni]|uniref:sensory neuron membrane protein 1-like n=1 Tax=Bactrocera tryoni TaxID=59916 RepID=UPI001A96C8FE|nr:sensory neuron membrane protein 1-like [Bactrocera tryoni]